MDDSRSHRILFSLGLWILVALLSSCDQSFNLSELIDGPDGKALVVSPVSATVQINESLLLAASGGIPPYTYTIHSGGGVLSDNMFTALPTPGVVVIRTQDTVGTARDSVLTIVDLRSRVDYEALEVGITFEEPLVGSSLSGNFSILNNGSAPGGRAVNWVVYASSDIELGDPGDRILASGSLPGTSPGSTTLVSFTGNWPSEAGGYYLLVSISAADDLNSTDNLNRSDSLISIYDSLAISPASFTVYTGQSIDFTVLGGTGDYLYALSQNQSGATFDLGVYVAGLTPGTDRVEVSDALLTHWPAATALVTVIDFPD